MPSPLTDAELTILGLLVEAPRHGYDLERVVEERGIRNWTALGFSSIYYILDKLAARGLIETVGPGPTGQPAIGKSAAAKSSGARSRVSSQPTALGREACAVASLDAISALTPLRVRVLVGMANSPALANADVRAHLARRATALRTRLDEVGAARSNQQPLPPAAEAIFDYSEALLRADLAWTESTLTTMRKERR